ncbi:RNA polymerase sigma factor (sigma-70 family) [Tumebacillus sp. BK434]|uniref:sigma-70 family RNA polymerase sigma factor n=1 Tax=Tumebacillus sp. BK434 TaxID=2512169 RepID=UPI0010511407|nr:sigma-70 family RNA polymerase sigma factor [Tumebacillus sp. BK434]TCP57993.1 RNA polymerase sigma factor (sigma-70 family) [Tumebacillus sp. BK434]
MENQTKHLDQLAEDCKRGTVSFEEVVNKMRKRIKAIAWQAVRAYERFKPMYDVEDYENRVLLALEKAIRAWDPEREAGFATYFERVAQYELNAVRKEMSALSRQSNLDAFSVEEHLTEQGGVVLVAADDSFRRSEFYAMFNRLPLTVQQRTICLLVMQGYKNKEIAASLCITEAAVSMALKRLRPKFTDAGLSGY